MGLIRRKERKRLNPSRYPTDAEVSVSGKDYSEPRNGAETGDVARDK